MTGEDFLTKLSEARRLHAALLASPGGSVLTAMERLQRTRTVFASNWVQLESMIGRFKSDAGLALEVLRLPESGRSNLDVFLEALDQPLHNFLASATTLVDHTRIVARETLDETALRLYEDRVSNLFVSKPRNKFVTDLRNYMLHYDLPWTSGTFSMERDRGVAHAITMEVEPLRQWSKWKAPSKDFLDQAGEQVDLHDLFSAYSADVQSFQGWFGNLVDETNRDVLAEAQQIGEKYNAIVEQIQPRFGS